MTDSADPNLGYSVSVDGGSATTPDNIDIDTSVAGTHTILFSATDQAGNVGTTTRTVIVADPSGSDASSTPPATSAANDNASTSTTTTVGAS